MPEPTVTPSPAPNTANQPSPKLPDPSPAKPKAKGEKAKEFVVLHMGVGEFVKGDKVDASDLFAGQPDDFDEVKAVDRLIELEAIAPNAE